MKPNKHKTIAARLANEVCVEEQMVAIKCVLRSGDACSDRYPIRAARILEEMGSTKQDALGGFSPYSAQYQRDAPASGSVTVELACAPVDSDSSSPARVADGRGMLEPLGDATARWRVALVLVLSLGGA